MNLVLWILFGALVGWIASLIIGHLSTRQAEMMTILGTATGIIGGWLANLIAHGSVNNFNIYSVLTAILISGLSIWLYGKIFLAQRK
jgi:uncharacterized membrane protein YeaQ/YmgE (transglycosylase-associated protein family)